MHANNIMELSLDRSYMMHTHFTCTVRGAIKNVEQVPPRSTTPVITAKFIVYSPTSAPTAGYMPYSK